MKTTAAYRVIRTREKGRAAVASLSLEPGEIVLQEYAVACVAAANRSVCDDCLTALAKYDRGKGEQCAGCRSLFDRRSSSSSSISNNALRGGITPQPCSAVRLAAKIIFRRCFGSLTPEQSSAIDELIHRHDGLQQHASEQKDGRGSYEQDEEDCVQVAELVAGMGCDERQFSSGAPLDLARTELGRVHLNAITTCDGSGGTGLGLFTSAAMFNHSCSPNCQAWWRGSMLEIRCTKPVAAGEELCFSYIPIDQPSSIRRAKLRHSWFFTCYCKRCATGQWDAELTGLRCPFLSCSGAVTPPWTLSKSDDGSIGDGLGRALCNKCGFNAVGERTTAGKIGKGSCSNASTSAAILPRSSGTAEFPVVGSTAKEQVFVDYEESRASLLAAGTEFEDGMMAYMREDPEVAMVALGKSVLTRERILHPFNKELLRTLRYGSYAAIATHDWAKANWFLSRWLQPMETMFGAAEVWDVAAMRVDAGLVLDRLQATTGFPASSPSPPLPAAPRRTAHEEIAEGLKWIRICLGRNSGLPAEIAALKVCADRELSV